MIVSSPPLQMGQQLWSLLGSGPGSTRQRSYPMADGQIDPFNEGGVQPSREAHSLQSKREICLCPQAHHVRDASELVPPLALFHLAGDQARCHLPLAHVPSS